MRNHRSRALGEERADPLHKGWDRSEPTGFHPGGLRALWAMPRVSVNLVEKTRCPSILGGDRSILNRRPGTRGKSRYSNRPEKT